MSTGVNRTALGLPPQDEESFKAQVMQLAQACGWVRAHFRPARTRRGWRTAVEGDGAGFPDLCLVRRGRIVFAELKRVGGQASPEQQRWLALLKECPVEVYLWTPADFAHIEEVLA